MPTIITPSPQELEAGRFEDETLFQALRSFHRDGFLVMEEIMDKSKLDGIKDFLLEEGGDIKRKAVPHKAEEDKPTSTSFPVAGPHVRLRLPGSTESSSELPTITTFPSPGAGLRHAVQKPFRPAGGQCVSRTPSPVYLHCGEQCVERRC